MPFRRGGADAESARYYSTNHGLMPLAMDDAAMISALEVFSGEVTCCVMGHMNAEHCDREELMLPMLGLFCAPRRL